MKPLFHPMPRLETLNLSGVLNSYVKCRLCRGGRVTATCSPVTLTYTYKKCQLCQGSGIISNRESKYDERNQ